MAVTGPRVARDVTFHAWRGGELAEGTHRGTTVGPKGLAFGTASGSRTYTDHFSDARATCDTATWASPVIDSGHAYTELVASWNATSPAGTWIEVRVRAVADDGSADWYVLGRWASDDPPGGGAIHRTSVSQQATECATVRTDTLVARSKHTLLSWQLEVLLRRGIGATQTPTVRLVSSMVSNLVDEQWVPVSMLGAASARGTDLAVPQLSQEVHRGHYPEWEGGGEAWCSPTSTAMVLGFWGVGPTPTETAWVDPPVDAVVDHAARHVYDHAYGGAGNWPFNTAYAACFGLEAFVTRLRSLTEAEAFIAAGIPLVASVSFAKGELTGAGYGTNGHLLVIRGFTRSGDVVVNDPASHLIADDTQVRVVYDRAEFESVWVPRSGGIVYVIHAADHPLPAAPAQANW